MTDELITEFSSRIHDIENETARPIAAYVERHGRQPAAKTIVKPRAQATLVTRASDLSATYP